MVEDKEYCMSSFLQFRIIADKNKTFKTGIYPNYYNLDDRNIIINSSDDIDNFIRKYIDDIFDEHTAIMLSGGIDSAILAKYLPKGTIAYTLKCIADVPTIDETINASKYAKICGLEHRVIEVTWDDYKKFMPLLMKHKGAPIHSIEPQIYKAALQAKKDGITKLIFGESADCIFGGLDKIMSKKWKFDDFVERYNFVSPDKVLITSDLILEPNENFRDGEYIDMYKFMSEFFFYESMNSYINSCKLAGIEFIAPYSKMYLGKDLDIERIKNGEPKYFIRELFEKLYPDFSVPKKTPMPRAVDQWLKNWNGPTREEFKENCIENLDGNQKWQVYCLEYFLNLIDENEKYDK